MTGLTNTSAQAILEQLILDYPHVGLFSVVGTDAGSGFTELAGDGYARVTTVGGDWAAATGTAPSTITNSNAITFPAASGADWDPFLAVGLFSLSTGGVLGAWDFVGNDLWQPAYVTSASPAVFDVKAHGLSTTYSIIYSTEYGGTAPTFSQSNFTGTLVLSAAATDTFSVTNSATAVNTSSTGSGLIRRVRPQTITDGVTAILPASSFVISLA